MADPQVILEPVAVKRSTAAKMLDCGATTIYELCRQGKLKTVKVGADDRVTVASIKEFAARGGKA